VARHFSFLQSVQTASDTHPSSFSVGSRNAFSWVKWHFYTVPRLRISGTIIVTPGYAFVTCTGTNLLYKQQEDWKFNLLKPTGYGCTTSLTFNNCTLCPHCIHVFCIYLRTNSNFCPIQCKLTGFYNQDGVCLLRGMDWVFK